MAVPSNRFFSYSSRHLHNRLTTKQGCIMTITNKLKTIAKTQINNIIQRIPVSDLRSILSSRGVLIFESERESHLHSLSVLHSDLKRMFNTGEVESYREGDHDYSTFHFDVYLTASLNLVDDLWIPGEEPPAVDAQRNLESAVQAWNAQHGTELLTIDESELSELQEEARRYRSGHNLDKAEISKIRARHTSALADQLSVIQQRDDEVRGLKEKLELEIRLRVEDAEEYNDMRGQRDALKKELAFTKERLEKAVDYQAKLISDAVDYADKCDLRKEEVDALKAQLAHRSLVIEELSHKLQTLSDYLDEAKYEHNRVVGDKLDTVGVCLDEARSLCSFDPLLTHR